MATQLESKRKSTRKYDEYVERQLERATTRVRRLDLLTRGLILLVGTLLYAVAVFSLDLWLQLPPEVRLAAFALYGLGMLAVVGVTLWQLISRRVNPYYAARQIEKTLPDAKGSVVNWLDLREEELPPAIRNTINYKAAKDVAKVDVDQAIESRVNLWLSIAAVVLFVPLLVMFLMGPGQVGSLFSRAFLPFKEVEIASRTEISLIEPPQGHLTITPGQKVSFKVQVTGRVPRVNQPDSLKLLYRYNVADPYIEQPLDRDAEENWVTTLQPDQVQSGFFYRITGGDARTPEFQVRVKSIPQVLRYEVVYQPRAYHAQPERKAVYPNEQAVFPHIKDYAGTKVTLTIHTNRELRTGKIVTEIDQQQTTIEPEAAADPKALRFRFTLEKSGTFRVHFVSKEGEQNADVSPHPLEVLTDLTPIVELTEPGKDVQLPANGVLELQGKATDDLGIKQLVLRLRPVKGELPPLKSKVYRDGKFPEPIEGRYPDTVDYRDFLDLNKVAGLAGQTVKLQAGMELEYWLEAIDNSDYPNPGGNVGKSKVYKLLLTEPEKNQEKVKKDQEQAQQKQKEHEKKQDRKEEERKQQEAERKRQEQEKQKQEQEKQKNGQNGEKSQQPDQGESAKDFEKKAQDLKKKLDDIEQKEKDRAQAKGAERGPEPQAKEQGQGEQKPAETKKGGEEQKQASEQKDQGSRQGPQPKQAQAKDGPMKQEPKGPDEQKGQARHAGEQKPEAQAKSDPQQKKDGQQCSACKNGQGPNASQAKAGEKASGNQAPKEDKQAEAKGEQAGGADQQARANEKKSGQDGGADQRAAVKDDPQPKESAGGQQHQQNPATAKKDGQQGGAQPVSAQAKQGDRKDGEENVAASKDGGRDRADPQLQGGPAQAKGQPREQLQRKAQGKQGGQGQADAQPQVKEGKQPGGRSGPQAERKDAPKDGAAEAGQAKAEEPPGLKEQLQRPEQGASKLEDLAKLKEQLKEELKRLNQEERDELIKELERLGKEANKKEVREAAQELAREAREQQAKEPTKGGTPGQQPEPGGQKTGDPMAGKQPGGKEPGSQQTKHQGSPGAGNQNPTGKTGSHDHDGGKELQATKDFERRGGDLQLEELAKKLTPEMLRKLKWTEQDRARFLQQAQAYEQWLRQQAQKKEGKEFGPGQGISLLPGVSPRQIGSGTPSSTNVDVRHVLPPPEFREAHRLFTGGEPRPK